jgi:formylglycine-generating enzyme required for sulfatase activity
LRIPLTAIDADGARRETAYRPDRKLGAGGFGAVFPDESDRRCVLKIYHQALLPDGRLKPMAADALEQEKHRLDCMLANPPRQLRHVSGRLDLVQIAWPTAHLLSESGAFVGFVMPFVDLDQSREIVELLGGAARRALVAGFPAIRNVAQLDVFYRLGVARNVAQLVDAINAAGHAVCDLNPRNVRVYIPYGVACLIDCDGFRITSHGGEALPCSGVFPEIMAPELLAPGASLAGADEYQDRFALAMLVFQLLNEGRTPFNVVARGDRVPVSDVVTHIRDGYYAYGSKPHDGVKPPPGSLHEWWPSALRAMLDRAFDRSYPRTSRPSAAEWSAFLASLMDQAKDCAAHGRAAKLDGARCMVCEAEKAAPSKAWTPPPVQPARLKPRPAPSPASVVRPRPPPFVPARQLWFGLPPVAVCSIIVGVVIGILLGPSTKRHYGVHGGNIYKTPPARPSYPRPPPTVAVSAPRWPDATPDLGVFKECDVCPEMVALPAGRFQMGDDRGDPNERPAHPVEIPRFAMARTEVTFAQWDACVADGGCDGYKASDYDNWGRGDRPVIYVSWVNAQSYVRWINRKVGAEVYRLPSEAEWEYAARAGTTTAYFWGDNANLGCPFANQFDQSAHRVYSYKRSVSCDDGFVHTAPVGSFRANRFGLSDMSGNVNEWTQDCYQEHYVFAPKDGSAWTSGDCSKAVLRGGSWNDQLDVQRSAHRWGISADQRSDQSGFRLSRPLGDR